jgi:hypothetical protein
MAFLKYAKATVVRPQVKGNEWDRVRVASGAKRLDASLKKKAEDILGEPFTPDRFLLTHSTIVCSVDAVPVHGSRTGSHYEEGQQINRKYADYRVTSDTDKFINNNLDCWSRDVIKKSYKTFIGAHNFVEHVQVEELSKGRIIDAVLRDVGESIYVDILVATDKKHVELVNKILSGDMNAMSMGCFVPNTPITLGDGTRIPISEIHVGDFVLTKTGDSKPVKNIMIHRSPEPWRMRTISAIGAEPITATANHPFFVARPLNECACGCGEKLETTHKSAQRSLDLRFKTGHDKRIFNPNNNYSEEEKTERIQRIEAIKQLNLLEIHASEINVGDYLVTPRVKDTSTSPVDRAKARLLGYFLAEGSFLKKQNKVVGVEFSFSFGEIETYAAEVRDLLKEAFPSENEARVYPREDRGSSRVHISSQAVAEWFFTHGGEYSNSKKLSVEVMNWSSEAHLEMIGAWINGDGTLHNIHKHTSACTTSYDLACQMEILLAKCGLYTRTFVKQTDGYRQTSYVLELGKADSQVLIPYCDKVASEVSQKNSYKIQDDFILRKVTSISESFYEGEVYDLEVEDEHTYLVQGVAVHNCSVDFTICTKCGHVAADEPQMCRHVRYEKGNWFHDENGNKHRVAELCGHATEGETGGVTFIEASWVEVPAFKGAVARNTLEIPSLDANPHDSILNQVPQKWLSKAASSRFAGPFDFDEDEGGGDEGGEEKAPEPPKSILDEIETVVKDAVIDRLKKKLEKEIQSSLAQDTLNPDQPATSDETTTDETLVKQARRQKLYLTALNTAVKVASSRNEALDNIRLVNDRFDVYLPPYVYKLAAQIPAEKYKDVGSYISRAENDLGMKLSKKDSLRLVKLAKLVSLKNGR